MRILVNGSSVSSGEFCWSAHIKSQIDCELINLSLAGAGNTYISHLVIQRIEQTTGNLVRRA
jgi:hypothetical protein